MTNLSIAALCLILVPPLHAQTAFAEGHLDPTRGQPASPQTHVPLPEHYLWTANDITAQRPDHAKFPWNRPNLRTDPHYFRVSFSVPQTLSHATLYIAGPRSARVWINGTLAAAFTADIDAPIGFHVFHADVAALLHPGPNTLAIQAVRGRGLVAGAGPIATQQITYGEVLAAKIVPTSFGVDRPALVISTPAWKSSATLTPGWQSPTFNDASWENAATLGPIESDPDLMQWSADAGMYEWPGYTGMSANLRDVFISPVAVTHIYEGAAQLSVPQTLNKIEPLTLANFTPATDSESPAILLDFGRELAGRLFLISGSPCDSTISVTYGESELEALATGLTPTQRGGNYLGTNLLDIAPRGVAYGPKSAFRYVRIRFLRGCSTWSFPRIGAQVIYYPVDYQGSFESSDPLLNRIWETGAYTVHLCMQDGIWDAPKRDRGRWVGDLDIEGPVISIAFGDSALLEDTLNRLAAATPPTQYVNGIPSYSALWLTSLDSLYMHSGKLAFLQTQLQHIRQILARLDQDTAAANLLAPSKAWGFVDWAPGLYGQTNETRIGTNLQYLRGYAAAARLLKALNDPKAQQYNARLTTLTDAARTAYLPTLGPTWQLNALAALTLNSPGAPSQSASSIDVGFPALANIKQDAPTDPVISPYFNAYLLDALALGNRSQQALDWIRTYWGGMLAQGATSFWESYDLRWPKTDFHLSLQADGTSGFFVSLAHGWSSGPTAWLSENVLGINPTAPGYATASIAPHLLGLDWARGTVPTPHGPIAVSIDKSTGLTLDLPAGIAATVSYAGHTSTLDHPGHFTFPAN